MPTLTSWRSGLRRIAFGALLLVVLSAGLAQAQSIPSRDVLYIHPFWMSFAGASTSDVATVFSDVRSRLGPEGPHVKLGIAVYLVLSMEDWNVDISNPAAVRGAMKETIGWVDAFIAKARAANAPISFSVLTAIRGAYDPVQRASENEDVRSVQWYANNRIAPGWWTHSRYARKAQAVQEAYVRELGRILANRMSLYPETLVAASGDGEVELARAQFWGPGNGGPAAGSVSGATLTYNGETFPVANGQVTFPDCTVYSVLVGGSLTWKEMAAGCTPDPAYATRYADYSPFTVAEFRDWIRLGGLYATDAAYAGQGYALGMRYAGDSTPRDDSNHDGHTFNGDFGTDFLTWDLRHDDWSLGGPVFGGDPRAISLATYSAPDYDPLKVAAAGGFDAPRDPKPINTNAWWDLWVLFKQTMLQHHNRDFAKWMTTSVDPVTGTTIPTERWYSYQIPADYLQGGTPGSPNPRWHSSMSSWWTADISPYGGLGITAFNVDWVNPPAPIAPFVARTLINVAPQIAGRGVRWGIVEWHPGVLPCDIPSSCGVSAKLDLFRSEMELVEQYRPNLLQPFAWDFATGEVKGTGFETALREMIARIKDGWRPAITQQPASQAVSAGATVTFTVTAIGPPDPTVRWQVSTDGGSTWTDVTDATGATYSFATVAADHGKKVRAVFTNVAGTTASTAATVGIFGNVSGIPAALRFAAVKTAGSGTLTAATGAQTVTVAFSGAPGAWTASATPLWLQVTGGSGAGPGQFTVALVNPDNVIGGDWSLSGSITIASSTASNSPVSIPVTLTVDQTGGLTRQPPIGLVDAPAQNATGQVGAIGVTGWVVDDVGVQSVKIYRNCLSFEPQGNCAVVNGVNLVYVGDATIVAGARSDIEGAYATYPQANRAAWGYLLLTSMLPHVPNQLMFGGQGTLTLYVLAEDMEGHKRWLGRDFVVAPSWTDEVPTTFTMANDTIAKPFGAIDTPKQGETVSGSFWNFGWTLTPDSNTTADADDILMPPDGSTQWVYIDGVAVGRLGAYNLCRGHVGSPVPAGLYCDDDVASIFGNVTPQPAFTPRSANATKHRNLDAGRGPQAGFWLDTTTLSNGIHTIVWGVTDSAGRGEGIGSRYFTVLNGVGDSPFADGSGGRDQSRPYGGTSAGDGAVVGDARSPGSEGLDQGDGGQPKSSEKAAAQGLSASGWSPGSSFDSRSGATVLAQDREDLGVRRGGPPCPPESGGATTGGCPYTITSPAEGRDESRPYARTLAAEAATTVQGVDEVSGKRVRAMAEAALRAAPAVVAAALRDAPAQSRGDARALETLAPATGPVWGRTEFDPNAPYADVAADEAGVRHVQIRDRGRLELRLGAVERGYLVANGMLRDLPPGSRLDPETGQFTWAPGLGYLGTYRLAFVRGGEQIQIDVTIRPMAPEAVAQQIPVDVTSGPTPAAASGQSEIRMFE